MLAFQPRPLSAWVESTGGTLSPGAGAVSTRGVAALDEAGEAILAPFFSPRWAEHARRAPPGAVILTTPALAGRSELSGRDVWVHEHASWALALVLDAVVCPEEPAHVGPACEIAGSVILGPRVRIGARVRIGPHAVIGEPGFGVVHGPGGAVRMSPQLGGVVIEDDVWIGAVSTVDAGTLRPTTIGRGVKMDAHVHVGHNARIGEGSILCAQVGIAGSVTIGRGVVVGGQAGIKDGVTVGDGARIGAKSGVIGDVSPGATVAGYPAMAHGAWLRGLARVYDRRSGHEGR